MSTALAQPQHRLATTSVGAGVHATVHQLGQAPAAVAGLEAQAGHAAHAAVLLALLEIHTGAAAHRETCRARTHATDAARTTRAFHTALPTVLAVRVQLHTGPAAIARTTTTICLTGPGLADLGQHAGHAAHPTVLRILVRFDTRARADLDSGLTTTSAVVALLTGSAHLPTGAAI